MKTSTLLFQNTAELRTIGLSDVVTSDSDLSIRHLELTPNASETSFRLTPTHRTQSSTSKHSKESIDSGCQNETHNGENIRHTDNNTWQHCDLNILDIKKCNSDNNHRKMDTLDLMTGNYRKSSSSTLSDVSSCSTNRSVSCDTKKQEKEHSPKYHSAVVRNRLRKDSSLVLRSKSFQEQDVRKTGNARFYILRRNQQHNDFDDDDHNNENFKLNKTISHHHIEITIEDTDANEQPINCNPIGQRQRKIGRNEWSSVNSSDYNKHRQHRSSHVWGRIFRRMRKLSMAWRKPKTKLRARGELKVFSTDLNTKRIYHY